MPARADVPQEMQVALPERRSFLGLVLAAASGAVGAVLAIPLVRFVTYPLRAASEQSSWSDVGKADEFSSIDKPVAKMIQIKQTDGWRSSVMQNGVYVVPGESGKLKVLSSVCPHLGCAVRWVGKQDEFVCPCHGGTFKSTGEYVSGPPRRGMDELESKVEDGVLKVRFQYFRQLAGSKEPVS